MKILAFNFEQLSVERFSSIKEGLKIESHVDLSEISEVKAELLAPKGKIIGVKFKFTVSYEPNFAKVFLKGQFLIEVPLEAADKMLSEWKKKKLNDEVQMALINLILEKSTLKALDLEEQIGLPLHHPMPSFTKK